MDIKWNNERRLIDDLSENPSNPRKMSELQGKKLRESIENIGLCQPIVIQPDGRIIGGHQRVRILKQLEETHVDVISPSRELTRQEESKLAIGLNKNIGYWDDDILANEWEVYTLLEAGFTEEELSGVWKEVHDNLMSDIRFSISLNFEDAKDFKLVKKKLGVIMNNFPNATMKVEEKCQENQSP